MLIKADADIRLKLAERYYKRAGNAVDLLGAVTVRLPGAGYRGALMQQLADQFAVRLLKLQRLRYRLFLRQSGDLSGSNTYGWIRKFQPNTLGNTPGLGGFLGIPASAAIKFSLNETFKKLGDGYVIVLGHFQDQNFCFRSDTKLNFLGFFSD